MSVSDFLDLNQKERELLLQSVEELTGKLHSLVERFYFHLLEDNDILSQLFRNSDLMKQHNMFNVSIGVIISNIDNPSLVKDHLDELIDRHKLYGVLPFHVPYFSDAYTKAITEVYGSTDPIMKIWLKIIHSTMEYFKSKL